jgi:SAM-dependent methyltransferase
MSAAEGPPPTPPPAPAAAAPLVAAPVVQPVASAGEPRQLSHEAVTWAFRLLIGREPAGEEEVARHRAVGDLEKLRVYFANTWEFQDFFDRVGLTGKPGYRLPLFLLRPPVDPAIPFRFVEPDLEAPVCQFCTHAQFNDPAFLEIIQALGLKPAASRQQWEQAYAVSVLATAGMIAPGRRGLGFGVGRERIPSLLASRGAQVLATDRPEESENPQRRIRMQAAALFYPDIVHLAEYEALVDYAPLDMNAVPAELDGQFDFCWSVSALDRLGIREKALAFIDASLRVLKPGGIAVHTFEFNISSNQVTVNNSDVTALRRQDIERLAMSLREAGHSIDPLNFHPGLDPLDEEVQSGPGTPVRPKRRYGAHVLTPFGLVMRKAG